MLLSVDKCGWIMAGSLTELEGAEQCVLPVRETRSNNCSGLRLRMLFICHRGIVEETERQAALLELNLMLGRSTFSVAYSEEKMICDTSPCIYTWVWLHSEMQNLKKKKKTVCGWLHLKAWSSVRATEIDLTPPPSVHFVRMSKPAKVVWWWLIHFIYCNKRVTRNDGKDG